jgi:hypothetical protein
VTVAVVRWEQVGYRQTLTALYLVDRPWEREGDAAMPWSVDADQVPDFFPGTHLAIIGFEAEGIGVSRLGDERSIDSLVDTRLFRGVLPVELVTPDMPDRANRTTLLKGLGRRLEANPRADRLEGEDVLPVNLQGHTYTLPVHFYVFAAGDSGSRRRFVARDHALLLLSNGQVHAHWTAADIRNRTTLPKLADRVLVTVDTDALPLGLRTSLFTADRTELLRSADAVRLEHEVIAFLEDWPDLRAANDDLVRDAIRHSNTGRSTASVALRIDRAYQVSHGDLRPLRDETNAVARRRNPAVPRVASVLLDDPTLLEGPTRVYADPGQTVGIRLALNARDGFLPRRSTLHVTAEHLDIDVEQDVTVGELRRGCVRVSVAIPLDAESGTTTIAFAVPAWVNQRGGLSESLACTVMLSVGVDGDVDGGAGPPRSEVRVEPRPQVAVLWTSHASEEGWSAATAGDVDEIPGNVLAEADANYLVWLNVLDPIPVVKINEEFAPLKAYAASRARSVGDEGVARAKDRYAVGVGLHLLLTHRDAQRRRAVGQAVDDDVISATRADAARAVLAVLPDFDALAHHAGLGPV